MNSFALRNKKIIVSVVMALMMVLAMMPSMAFADTALAINPVGTVYVGDTPTLSVTPAPDNTTAHIDWSSSNESVATISTHNGQITAIAAGNTTITAKLIQGPKPSGTGTGGGNGSNCTGAELATATMTISVQPTNAYGAQGISGQTLKMVSPSDITAGTLQNGQIVNRINGTLTASDGYYGFQFELSAGMNNFKEQQFLDNNMPLIKVTQGGQDKATYADDTLVYNGHVGSKITISVDADALTAPGEYVLEFGSGIAGNNSSKTLGADIKFTFNI